MYLEEKQKNKETKRKNNKNATYNRCFFNFNYTKLKIVLKFFYI